MTKSGDMSLQYKNYQGNVDRDTFFFRNFFAWPTYLSFTNKMRLQYVNSRVNPVFVECPEEYKGDNSKPIAPVNNDNKYIYALALLKMRRQMETETNARVILGGRTSGFSGFMPGVIEEFIQSAMAGHPIYLLGGFGGAVSLITSLINKEKNVEDVIKEACEETRYADFMSFCHNQSIDMGYNKLKEIVANGIDCLNNGLENEDNYILFQSTDVIEIVGLIIKGLKKQLNMHRVFVSFYHRDDQHYKDCLVEWAKENDVFIDGSVDTGDIPDDWDDQKIRETIRDEYLQDTSVTILLVGPNTRHRKHVDWEIYSSMYDGKKNKRSGIVVVMLPETYCEGCHIPYANEKMQIYPEVTNWVSVDSRSEYERRYPDMPERIIDNLMKDGVKISVTTWNKLTPDNLRLMLDNAYDNRLSQPYDLSRDMRRKNGNC